MSDSTLCNWCLLRLIKRRAKAENKKVTILCDANWGLGGVNVYVYPKNVDIRKMKDGEDGAKKKYRTAWFQELSQSCCC